ncbi:WxL domain-containing protein [Enterococcus sp. HY326]|uniref:WxL domain-containing protein n=1 Tax=Enterococcus sp. HY326 TaxID=2971265 RepID=UPI0022407D2C|nr:WxL domain-containing protein [Enterococcus sp. HY326]
MKVRTLSAAALLAVLGVATVAPVAADATAQTHSLNNTGKIVIEAGELDPETDPVIDPEKPTESIDPKDPDLEKPGTPPGQIGMLLASPLDFGTLKVKSTTQTATAAAYMAGPLAADGSSVVTDWDSDADKVERGNIVTWGDMRGTDAGYTITAQMTQQFTHITDTSKALTGSTLTYNNALLATRPDETTGDTTGGLIPANNFTLGIDGAAAATATTIGATAADTTIADSQLIVNAAKDFGGGHFTLEFGQSAGYTGTAGTKDTAGKAITLTIPQATSQNMSTGTYEAVITWTMNWVA